ncbi:MAG: cysteine desulfurase family protein [Bacilli bacterium]|nr:cysteine desulfurase family protein [Bacilli bacterium]MDD4282473.1 cysteine desulfurase family protein [Bacilli bacterium]MDD4719045.1 cysteine desulfurase family protein [Bacilli bacterium]
MIYLDYSATTPVRKEVLETYVRSCEDFIGNPNSIHRLGVESKHLIDRATEQIANILKVKPTEIIYTSGSTESNNLIIKGIASKYKNRGNHIITTGLEHSSIYGPLNYLQSQGFEVDFVQLDEFGMVDLDNLKDLIRDTTILVSVASVNSEIGLLQPIDEIGKMLKDYPKCFFHVDMTQSVGKVNIDMENIDLATFSPHKFYGLKGISVLVKKEKIELEPLIHGGKSTTIYRSGTPALPLIVSCSKALRLATENLNNNLNYVKELRDYLINELKEETDIVINSNDHSIPYIINISVPSIKPDTFVYALENYNIFISTQSACSSGDGASQSVYALTKSDELAESSLRICLSHLTTKDEVNEFIKCFKICKNHLRLKK